MIAGFAHRTPRRQLIAATALSGLALAAAGCGSSAGSAGSRGSGASAYQNAVQAAAGPWLGAFQAFQAAVQGAGGDASAQASASSTFSAADTAFASALAALAPPIGSKDHQRLLVADLNTVSADLGALAAAAKGNNQTAAQAAESKIQSDAQKVQTDVHTLE